MEIMELPADTHPYFVAVQYHPEYISRPLKPSPPYLGLVLAAAGKLQMYLNNTMSSNTTSDDGENSGKNCKNFLKPEYILIIMIDSTDDDLVGMLRRNISSVSLSGASAPATPPHYLTVKSEPKLLEVAHNES